MQRQPHISHFLQYVWRCGLNTQEKGFFDTPTRKVKYIFLNIMPGQPWFSYALQDGHVYGDGGCGYCF